MNAYAQVEDGDANRWIPCVAVLSQHWDEFGLVDIHFMGNEPTFLIFDIVLY